jgi:hypothetical protein
MKVATNPICVQRGWVASVIKVSILSSRWLTYERSISAVGRDEFMKIAEDAVGLAVLAGEFAVAKLLIPSADMSLAAWLGLFSIVAMVALASWHSTKAPQKSLGWLQIIAASVVLGAISFAVDILIGHLDHPNLPLIEAGAEAPFGFFLTLVFCPGMTVIAVAALVRSVFRAKTAAMK